RFSPSSIASADGVTYRCSHQESPLTRGVAESQIEGGRSSSWDTVHSCRPYCSKGLSRSRTPGPRASSAGIWKAASGDGSIQRPTSGLGWLIVDDRLAGALRRLPGGAAFSGRTAAWLHRLEASASDLVEVTVPPGSGISARSG